MIQPSSSAFSLSSSKSFQPSSGPDSKGGDLSRILGISPTFAYIKFISMGKDVSYFNDLFAQNLAKIRAELANNPNSPPSPISSPPELKIFKRQISDSRKQAISGNPKEQKESNNEIKAKEISKLQPSRKIPLKLDLVKILAVSAVVTLVGLTIFEALKYFKKHF